MSDKELLLFNDIYNQTQHFGRTQFVREIMKLQQENKILRENAEHNDKVVDKVNWENLKLKKELEEYKNLENQQKEFIEWLTNEANINPYDISDYIYENIINVILSKYNGIIGSDSE